MKSLLIFQSVLILVLMFISCYILKLIKKFEQVIKIKLKESIKEKNQKITEKQLRKPKRPKPNYGFDIDNRPLENFIISEYPNYYSHINNEFKSVTQDINNNNKNTAFNQDSIKTAKD